MIIWILNHYAISPKSIGGTRHFDLAQELVKEGHTVRIFASSFNHFKRKETIQYDSKTFKEEIIDSVKFTWIKTPAYNNSIKRLLNIGIFSIRLSNVLDMYLNKEKPDLIIGSSVHPLTPLVGIRKAKKYEVLFYFEERDLWPQTFIDFGVLSTKNIVTKMLFKIERYLYINADKVIFLFDKAHNYAYTKGLSSDKPIYLPNGFSAKRASVPNEYSEIDEILAPLIHKKLCIYTGSMGEANHMIPLIDLAYSMQNESEYHFLFVGNGPLKSSIIQYSEEKGLKNVSFYDSIPKEQVPYLLSHGHCGLIAMKDSPLYNWGFSMNKIYDYLSLGLPIIMYSNLQDLGDIEESKGIFSSSSIEQLSQYILDVSTVNRTFIKSYAFENYSWEVLARRLVANIEESQNTK